MIQLTDEETRFYEEQKVCHICRKKFAQMKMTKKKFKIIIKSEIIVILKENLEELHKMSAI